MHHSQLEYLIAVQKLQGESAGVRGITLADYMNVSASYIVKLSVYFEPIVSEELWEKCRQIRESKAMKIKSYGGKERVVGFKPSNDIWVKKMKCRCGSSFRRCKWHKNKSGELIYGYQCYNQ